MTNSNLQHAREVLEDGIQDRPPRERGVVFVGAVAAVALALGIAGWQALADEGPAAPDPSSAAPSLGDASDVSPVLSTGDQAFLAGEAPTSELLQGVWRLDNPTDSRMLFAFSGDGGFSYDDRGSLTEEPLVTGTYRIEDGLLSVDVDGGVARCAGQTIQLRAAVNSRGGLNVLPVGPDIVSCERPDRAQWVLERLLPMNEGWVDLTVPRGANWDPPTGRDALLGTWLAGAGRYLIELREDGSFSRLAGTGEVVDRGIWSASVSASMLTLTSSGDFPTCRQGDKLILAQLRARDIGTLAVHGEVERDDCGLPPWYGWFRLSP